VTTEDRVVLFVDILGFAALCEQFPIDIEGLTFKDRILSPSLDIISHIQRPRNPLSEVFSDFHYSLKWVLQTASMRHPLTAITFSDSAFIATHEAFQGIDIAINLIESLMPQKVPVRIGIGYGSFSALRFRSDITSTSGDHAAQFLGTSVVRSHAAETCGIKGIRILLHPSVMPLLADIHLKPPRRGPNHIAIRAIECSEAERSNKAGVTHEIDYWYFAPTREAAAWRGLQDMWNEAPTSAQPHYQATAEAINRMRIARGFGPLGRLRRRTLPKWHT
jgi:hypothetical protein